MATIPLYNTTAADQCKKIIIRSAQVYHISKQSIYQSWPQNSLSSPTDTINVTPLTTKDFDVEPSESNVVIATTQTSSGGMIYNLNATYHRTSTQFYNQGVPPFKVATSGSNIFALISEGGLSKLLKLSMAGVILTEVSMVSGY